MVPKAWLGVRGVVQRPTLAIPVRLRCLGRSEYPCRGVTVIRIGEQLLTTATFRAVWSGVLAPFAVLTLAHQPASSQTPETFVSLFDGETLSGWVVEEDGDVSVGEAALRVAEPRGWVRFERELSDFVLELEFRLATDGADSGVFVRAGSTGTFGRGWPGGSYQIQLRDMDQPSRFLPLGQIYRHGMPDGETVYAEALVDDLYMGVGAWHALRIEVSGSVLTVELDGQEITRADHLSSPSGCIGFQAETGVVEYRSIRLHEPD